MAPCYRTPLGVALAALLCSTANPACGKAANDARLKSKTQIVMLGTGTPLAEPRRSGPSVAMIVSDIPYLVDFGPSVVRQASHAARTGIPALRPRNLGFAFATHLHADHTTGLADLLLAPWALGRSRNLELYGPPGIEAMAERIESAYSEDIKIRLGPLSFTPLAGSAINAHDVAPDVIFKTPHLKVEAFAVEHGSWKHAYGYRFDTADPAVS